MRERLETDMTSFFEHQRTSYKRSYMRNLIALASSDGSLDEDEIKLIYTIGARRGLKDWQISELLEESEKFPFFMPESVGNRMNLLYDVMQIVYADGKVSDSEFSFITNIIAALKLDDSIVKELLALFEQRTPTIMEWNDFIENVVEIDSKRFITIL